MDRETRARGDRRAPRAQDGETGATPGRARFDDRPLLVFWETTKACDLACVHCRASAQPEPGPDELTTEEAVALVDELASLGSPRPILVLTGGDCLKRSDLRSIVAHAKRRAVPVAVSPSVTPLLGEPLLASLRELGVKSASVSLDGATAATHDRVRRIPGHFDATLAAIARLRRNGFSVQVNTTVMSANLGELADLAALCVREAVDAWEVFFLVATGRGTAVAATTAEENEDVCHFLVDASRYGFAVRTVEAPFFRRVLAERSAPGGPPAGTGAWYARLHDRLVSLVGEATGPVRAPSVATRDGKGVVFVAADGSVHASGFLPTEVGHVRRRGLVATYREATLLRAIRASRFTGACGSCEHRELCGGSRARAFAATGDPLASDPGCVRVAGMPEGQVPV